MPNLNNLTDALGNVEVWCRDVLDPGRVRRIPRVLKASSPTMCVS